MLFNSNDYPKDKEYRAQKMREANRERRASEARPVSAARFHVSSVHLERRWVALALVMLLVLIGLALPQLTHADDISAVPSPGQAEFFGQGIMHYRVGNYYFFKGDYPRAVDEFTLAIEGIPPIVLERSAEYATLYWSLGDAQLMAGEYDAALESYQTFLELVGEAASEQALVFVERLQASLLAGLREQRHNTSHVEGACGDIPVPCPRTMRAVREPPLHNQYQPI